MEAGYVMGQSDNLPKVDGIMVADYFGNNPHFTSAGVRGVKTMSSGRENYGEAAVGYVQLARVNNICTVKTKITPEHRVRTKNYSVIVEVDEGVGKIVRAKCEDCAASAGGCKHAVAVLMWLHRRSEEPAPTETICYWKKSRLSRVGTSLKFLTTEEFGKPVDRCVSNFTSGNFLREFIQKAQSLNIDSQIIKYHPNQDCLDSLGMHQLICRFLKEARADQSCEQFLKFAKQHMTQEVCDAACICSALQSDCKLWYELRYGRMTASKIYEAARCKTARGTFVESVIGALKFPDTAPMKRRRILEKKVLDVLQQRLKLKFQNVGIKLCREHVVLGASPDSVSEEYVIEVKCPSSHKTMVNYVSDNLIKNKYKAQIQLQMYLFKKSKGIFCVADPEFEQNQKLHILYENLDVDFIEDIINSAESFWSQNIFPILISSVNS